MTPHSSIVWLAVVAGAVAAQAHGDAPAAGAADKGKADLYGDPLPEGAVLRLGTTRLRSSASLLFFSSDGRTLITRDDESRTVQWWSAEDGALRDVFTLPTSYSLPEAFSSDGKRYINGDDSSGVIVRDVASGVIVGRLPKCVCDQAAFSPDGEALAAWSWNGGPIHLWNLNTRAERIANSSPRSAAIPLPGTG